MPNRDRLYLINNSKILNILLNYSGKIRYRRRLVGYGRNELSFDDKSTLPEDVQISRKIFLGRRESLLTSKLISILPSSDGRENVYTITPLGILYLINNNEIPLAKFDYQKILEVVDYHAWIRPLQKKQTDPILFKKMISTIDDDIVSECIHEAIKNIRIENRKDGLFMYCIEGFPFSEPIITKMYSIINSKAYIVKNFKDPFNVQDSDPIDDKRFYRDIGTLIYHYIHLELYRKLSLEEIPEFYKNKIFQSVERNLIIWSSRINESEKNLDKEFLELPHKSFKEIVKLLPALNKIKKEIKKRKLLES